MALIQADRVCEYAVVTGTGALTLTGALPGFQTFAAVGSGNTCYYTVLDTSNNWEVGLGTYSSVGPTLSRTTVISSSNGGSLVDFPSESVKEVFVTYPAEKAVILDSSGNTTALGTVSSGTWHGAAIGIGYGGTAATTYTAPSGTVCPLLYYDGSKFTVESVPSEFGIDTASRTLAVNNITVTTGPIREHKSAVAASNIDLSTGNYFSKTISGVTTFTVSNVPTTGTAISFILDLTNGGSATVNWWTGVKWAGGTSPTLTASGRDVLGFFTYDEGTIWTGLVLGKDVK